MVKARARTTARKVKDKWKSKQWYTIQAPAAFNKVTIAETPSDEPEKLVGRVASTTLQDLTGDFKMMHVKLDFQVERVTGTTAESRFVGHSLTSDYVRRLVRRNHSRIFVVFDVTTKDGALIRVKPLAVTEHRCQASQETLLRSIIQKTCAETAANLSLGDFVKELTDGRLAGKIAKACKAIYPLRKIELYRSEVRQAPTITLEDIAPAPEAGSDGTPPPPSGEVPSPEEGGPEPAAEEPAEEQRPVEVATKEE